MRNRRPAPHRRPSTAAELILDLEARANAGDPESSFEVPGPEWALLVEFARDELTARRAEQVTKIDAVEGRSS